MLHLKYTTGSRDGQGGLSPHTPGRLYYSYFPRSRRLLAEQLVRWLVEIKEEFHGTMDFAHALLVFAEEATMSEVLSLRYR